MLFAERPSSRVRPWPSRAAPSAAAGTVGATIGVAAGPAAAPVSVSARMSVPAAAPAAASVSVTRRGRSPRPRAVPAPGGRRPEHRAPIRIPSHLTVPDHRIGGWLASIYVRPCARRRVGPHPDRRLRQPSGRGAEHRGRLERTRSEEIEVRRDPTARFDLYIPPT
ncbi:hypothetical protein EEB14_24800 [Rhodococcus sp. WS4]|nr:hypothetical protein EEB14_24800 [Rhodococcus sp. WS4]